MAKKKKIATKRAASPAGTVAKQRAIQDRADAIAKKNAGKKKPSKAVQACSRRQPQNPLPRQHLAKPGDELYVAWDHGGGTVVCDDQAKETAV